MSCPWIGRVVRLNGVDLGLRCLLLDRFDFSRFFVPPDDRFDAECSGGEAEEFGEDGSFQGEDVADPTDDELFVQSDVPVSKFQWKSGRFELFVILQFCVFK